MPLRIALGAAGIALMLVGLARVAGDNLSDLTNVAVFLVGGVIVHDAVIAPLLVVLGLVGTRVLPSWSRGPAAAGLLVLGSVTLMAIPVLGRFGAKTDDPGLLNRPYGLLWLAFAVLVLAAVVLVSFLNRRRATRPAARAGGR